MAQLHTRDAAAHTRLTGYDRFNNPYARVAYDGFNYAITFQGSSLLLDFKAGTRTENK